MHGITKTFVDGDIVAYRSAASAEAKDLTTQEAEDNVDSMLSGIVHLTLDFPEDTDWEVYLTGKNNFRFDVAKSHPYKGNRVNKEKPKLLSHLRDYMVEKWGAEVADGEEADDLCSKSAYKNGYSSCIASVDKDLLMVPCWHYNFVKDEFKFVEPFEGLVWFYTQVLTGDAADHVKGLHRVGPKKAAQILDGATTELGLYRRVLEAYDGDRDRVVENGQLLWMRREENEYWSPPE